MTLLHSSILFLSFVVLASCQFNSAEPELLVTDVVTFDTSLGKIQIGLFGNVVPNTVKNFKQLCVRHLTVRSNNGGLVGYKGSIFHRVIPGFMIQGGNTNGGNSIFGGKFADENFTLRHYGAGWLSMANAGRDTNGSQFFITVAPTPHLDGKHVVFGKVLKGFSIANRIANVPTTQDKPNRDVQINDCIVQTVQRPFTVSADDATN